MNNPGRKRITAFSSRFYFRGKKGSGPFFRIMQKDFKIGLAIGAFIVAGACIWLATLPGLSARARAIQAASKINPSPKTPVEITKPVVSPQSTSDSLPSEGSEYQASRIQNPESRIENPDANNETQAMNNEQQIANTEIRNTNDDIQTRIHIVQKGDTLSSISTKYYGSANQWRKILAANRDNLPDPNRLTPGTKLIIP